MQLVKGIRFHHRVRAEWGRLVPGQVPKYERALLKYEGRRGRADLWIDAEADYKVVYEIKSTDWDRVIRRRVREYVRRHGMQLHDYLAGDELLANQVTMAVIYLRAPRSKDLRRLVEEGMTSMGFTVLWWADQSASPGMDGLKVLGVNWR
jgi:hypothetical protein